jgi:hypothetical protein
MTFIPWLLLALLASPLGPQGPAWAAPPADSLDYIAERVHWQAGETRALCLIPISPWTLDRENIVIAMRRLAYQRRGLSWSGKMSVFPAPLRKRLAPLIARQWAKADAGERVRFQVTAPGGKILLQGDTFLTAKGMHWRLTAINFKKRPLGDFHLTGEPWRLVPISGQDYLMRQRFQSLDEELTNWLVLKAFRPDPKRKQPPRPAPADVHAWPDSPNPAMREKLELLEELRRERSISEADYQKKRKELLESP